MAKMSSRGLVIIFLLCQCIVLQSAMSEHQKSGDGTDSPSDYAYSEDITEIKQQLEELEKRLRKQMSDMETEARDLKSDLHSKSDEIGGLRTALLGMKQELQELREEVQICTSHVNSRTEQAITNATSKIEKVEVDLVILKSQVDTHICQHNLTTRRRPPALKLVKLSLLPTALRLHEAVYDGVGSIYIIGGDEENTRSDNVYKYDIDSEDLTVVGKFVKTSLGAAVMVDGNRILYFGGQTGTDERISSVFSFSVTRSSYAPVCKLHGAMEGLAIALDSSNRMAYLFGGYLAHRSYSDDICRYDTVTNELQKLGHLPEAMFEAAAVWDNSREIAYIFGGAGVRPALRSNILQFDPATFGVTKLPKGMPYGCRYPCAIFATLDDNAYIIGGHQLIKFSPDTGEAVNVTVDGWPSSLSMCGCTYVERLNRIYIFGGYGSYGNEKVSKYRNEISYIDLGSHATCN